MQFSSDQRGLAIQAMDEAEERTLGYYCIPPYQWQRLRYDLVTRQDCEWEPIPDSALARVQRLHQVRPEWKRVCDFYRIQLNDPSILSAAQREKLDSDLYPFLVYILTHEMVHLVRLSTILPEDHASDMPSETEENRVCTVSYRILSRDSDRRLDQVLSRFSAAKFTAVP